MITLRTQNTRMLIAASLTLAVVISAVAYVTAVLERDGAELEKHVAQLHNQQAYEQEYLALERLLLETADDRSKLAALILDGEEDTVQFLSEVDRLAARLGIDLVTEALEVQVQKDDPFDILSVKFSITGREAEVLQMIRLLEVWPYHSRVVEATVRRTDVEMESMVTLAVTIDKQ